MRKERGCEDYDFSKHFHSEGQFDDSSVQHRETIMGPNIYATGLNPKVLSWSYLVGIPKDDQHATYASNRVHRKS